MSGKTFEATNSSRLAKRRVSGENVPPFYVFNATEGGYVIVSGDDRTREILGYSSTGTLDLDDLPDNLQWWLNEYARQIEGLSTTTSAMKTSQKASTRLAISPLIHTQWNQHEPYNLMCPDGNGRNYDELGYNASSRCVTGCVATAMAQVMNYWQWPKSCSELPAYNTKTRNYAIKALPSTTFKWGLMKNSYSSGEKGDAANAVAELMRYCGQAVHMDYTTYESASSVLRNVMVDTFGYSHSISETFRDDYNLDTWENIIYKELVQGRPVLYSGRGENGGHEFIVDGYASNGLFHINWGWGGYQDNYFVLSAADSSKPGTAGASSSGGYKSLQHAMIGIKPFREGEVEPYALLSDDGLTVTFYYDGHMLSRKGVDIGDDSDKRQTPYVTATTAIFDDSFAGYQPYSTRGWFEGCSNLKEIKGVSNLNTEYVTDMWNMFYGCSSLTSLDVSGFNNDNVTNMSDMFYGCSSLTNLNLSGFKTDNVTYMGYMFYGCSSLRSLDVSGFKTANVTYMSNMFSGCSSLTDLNLSGFKTANVTGMSNMFYGCSSLTNLNLSGFKTDNVTDMSYMFYGCSSLTNLDVSGFKTGNVTDMSYMFSGCSSLTNLNLSGFKTGNVTGMVGMFYNCSSLTSLNVSGFNNDNVTNMSDMFRDCSSLTDLNLSGFKTDNVTGLGSMFCNCSSLTSLDLSGFKTDNVTYMSGMFYGCSSLTSLDLSGFKTDNVTDMRSMFSRCSSLKNLDVSGLKNSNVTDMSYMFYGCSSLMDLDLSGFKTDNVTDMSYMFFGCSKLTSLDLSGFKTGNVTDMSDMFEGCSSLMDLDLSGFKTDNVTDMSYMFSICSSLTTIYAGDGWGTEKVTSSNSMFSNCTKLIGGQGTEYNSSHTDHIYAHIDGGAEAPGYFCVPGQIPPRPYAVLSEEGKTVTFYFDTQRGNRGGVDINTRDELSSPYASATIAVIDASFADYRPTSTSYWFMRCSSLTTITGIENLKTDNVTNMSYMFFGCSKLTSLDLSGLKTNNVKNMSWMFGSCSKLTTIYAGNGWNTEKVTFSNNMFSNCTKLVGVQGTEYDSSHTDHAYAHIDGGAESPGYFCVPGQIPPRPYAVLSDEGKTVTFYYDTQKENRGGVDIHTSSLYGLSSPYGNATTAVIDVSFADYHPTSTACWFSECYSLTTITGIENLKTDNVTDMALMFAFCPKLASLDLSGFKTDNVKGMGGMFYNCTSLMSLDLSSFKTGNVTDISSMFFMCYKLTTIYAGDGWSTEKVMSGDKMFYDCPKLVGEQGTEYDSSHTDHTYARIDEGGKASGYLTYKVPSGIKGITVGNIINGNVPVYDIGGHRLMAPQKGMNIIGGKKVYVK